MRVVVGTRGSPLALAQTGTLLATLKRVYPQIEFALREIKTQGDISKDAPLGTLPRGLFAKELEQALLKGEIDLAVHSFKDLAAETTLGTQIAAISAREDARDVLVSRSYKSIESLPYGARLGTSSVRRAAQLKAFRPDLEIVAIRGNVGTRVEKGLGGTLAGVVLAAAGMHRLGLEGRIAAYIDPALCLPEAGQGALAVQVRAADHVHVDIARAVEDKTSCRCVNAEVEVVRDLGGGCTVPIGAYAQENAGEIWLRGVVAEPQGRELIRAELRGRAAPEELGRRLAEELRRLGGDRLLAGRVG